MIQYEINTGGSTQLATFYDEWDVAVEDRLENWNALTNLDREKYIKFDDGSELYAKIYLIGTGYVRTSAGTHRTKDIIHCSKPKYKHWGYSGASDNEESFNVRPASKNEKAKAHRMMTGHKPRTMTRRVRMLVLDELKTQAETVGINAEYVTSRLKDWADGNGQHAFKALESLCGVQGVSLKAPEGDHQLQLSIADTLGITGTVQDKRKGLPTTKQLKKIAESEQAEVTEIMTIDAVEF